MYFYCYCILPSVLGLSLSVSNASFSFVQVSFNCLSSKTPNVLVHFHVKYKRGMVHIEGLFNHYQLPVYNYNL